MTAKDIWVEFVGALLCTIFVSMVVALMDRGRRRISVTEPNILKPPGIHFVIGVVYCFIMFGPAIASLFFPAPLFVTLGFTCMGLPGIWILASSWRTRFEVRSSGIFAQTLFRRRTWIPWEDVILVRWAGFRQSFVLITKTEGKVRIDSGLRGLPIFARHLLASVAAYRIDAKAIGIMRNVARGILPEIRTG